LIHFDFENRYEDEQIVGRAISAREAVVISVVVHALMIVLFQYGPDLNFLRPSPEEVEARKQELMRRQEIERANQRFVFVEPKIDMKAPEPKPNVDLSDLDRRAQAPQRAAKPDNPLPFSRGNSAERTDTTPSVPERARGAETQVKPNDEPPQPQPEEVELGRYLLPEWDHRRGLLRRDWCTVVETLPLASPRAAAPMRLLPPPRQRAANDRMNRARRLRRQLEGDDIDLDAAIEVMVDRRLGLAPAPRLFRRFGREATRASVLVLLDLSESANDACADGGDTVLALEQAAALQLVQAVQGRTSRVAVHGFNSNTREHVSYQRLLDFGATFDARAAGRVGMARARHSTRMGAALRHATDVLAEEDAQWCTLLVVTDGAPSDIDVFDPHYLVEDARVAVQEARRRGVLVQCVTLDPNGEADARRIFGWHHYRVVTNPRTLTQHLRHVQSRATAA